MLILGALGLSLRVIIFCLSKKRTLGAGGQRGGDCSSQGNFREFRNPVWTCFLGIKKYAGKKFSL